MQRIDLVNEAMAAGLPALVSDAVGCAPDLIRPGCTGEQFPLGDHAALVRLMVALAARPAQLAALGAAAQRHIQRFAVELATEGAWAAIHVVAGERSASLVR